MKFRPLDWIKQRLGSFKKRHLASAGEFNPNNFFNSWFSSNKDEVLQTNETIFSIITRLANTDRKSVV